MSTPPPPPESTEAVPSATVKPATQVSGPPKAGGPGSVVNPANTATPQAGPAVNLPHSKIVEKMQGEMLRFRDLFALKKAIEKNPSPEGRDQVLDKRQTTNSIIQRHLSNNVQQKPILLQTLLKDLGSIGKQTTDKNGSIVMLPDGIWGKRTANGLFAIEELLKITLSLANSFNIKVQYSIKDIQQLDSLIKKHTDEEAGEIFDLLVRVYDSVREVIESITNNISRAQGHSELKVGYGGLNDEQAELPDFASKLQLVGLANNKTLPISTITNKDALMKWMEENKIPAKTKEDIYNFLSNIENGLTKTRSITVNQIQTHQVQTDQDSIKDPWVKQ